MLIFFIVNTIIKSQSLNFLILFKGTSSFYSINLDIIKILLLFKLPSLFYCFDLYDYAILLKKIDLIYLVYSV